MPENGDTKRMTHDDTEPWVDANRAAEHLGVEVRYLYRAGDSVGIPCARLNRVRRYRISEINRWMHEQRQARAQGTEQADA